MKLKTSKMALKGQKTTSDFLEWDKMQTIVLKLERDNDLKFALLIATGSYIGLRISDLLQLRWNQVLNQDYFTITDRIENFRLASTKMESGFESRLLHHYGEENQKDPQSNHQPRVANHSEPFVYSAPCQ
ncbi:hypothetical protein [Flavobacterium yafengii]|uniref:hypothetical protein n=1 Tax=Flavobacterium yafengii TaxID=3041253 RepID=UPI0024A9821A|nr:hypothetical protein [Flavobacterium yafengii]MDI5887637.1 hypothetical protein [Flavobacterium yafengii]